MLICFEGEEGIIYVIEGKKLTKAVTISKEICNMCLCEGGHVGIFTKD